MSILVQNIEKHLVRTGLTQKSLALKAGLNETAVRDILQGKSKDPQYRTLKKLSTVLGISVAELYGDGYRTAAEGLAETSRKFRIPETCAVMQVEEIDLQDIDLRRLKKKSINARVKYVWSFPRDVIAQKTSAASESIKILVAAENETSISVHAGDRILVDLSDRDFLNGGFYAVMTEKGIVFSCASKINTKNKVIGRALGHWNWL